MPRPSIIFVPGAWHCPAHLSPLMSRLTELGYHCASTSLPSTGPSVPGTSFEPDVQVIRNTVLAELDRGQDVVLVTHSYGGIPGASALCGLSTQDRTAAGFSTSVVGLAMICSFIVPARSSLFDLRRDRETPPWHVYDGDLLSFGPPGPRHCSITTSHRQKRHIGHRFSVHGHGRLDKMIPSSLQEKMVQGTRDSGAQIRVEELESGHSPFYSMPEQTADFIRRTAGEHLPQH